MNAVMTTGVRYALTIRIAATTHTDVTVTERELAMYRDAAERSPAGTVEIIAAVPFTVETHTGRWESA